VNRDSTDHIVDLQLVKERNRKDHDHTADSTDPKRTKQSRG
jgi:hypothetical protein